MNVKLCGLMTQADVAAAYQAGADYIGFVLAPSKRQVHAKDVARWLKDSHARRGDEPAGVAPLPVLVVVDAPISQIVSWVQETGVHHVQLCGDETADYCARLRSVHGLTVWKAWGVQASHDDQSLVQYLGAVDAVLLDKHAGSMRGGTGKHFAWEQIDHVRRLVADLPLIIAGGLDVLSVTQLLANHHPFGVDVSSGIETDGHKDPLKMKAFVDTVRSVPSVPR